MCSNVYSHNIFQNLHTYNNTMAKRITIMIDDDLDRKLRLIQAKQITRTSESISYSRVVNEAIRKQLK